jgi:ABC-2 type transport system permease protein
MSTTIPSTSKALQTLLRADFTTQWRNRRSVILVLLVPVIILITWKGLVNKVGGPFVISNCITIGLIAIGLMGYSISIARDRDKGVFQRLRVAPVPTWSIMVSRLIVQLTMILVLTTISFYIAYKEDKIILTISGYFLGFVASIIGGALYLGLGQMIVGFVKNSETVNSTTRLVYFVFIMVGMLGQFADYKEVTSIVHWSPYGTVKNLISASLSPVTWTNDTTMCLVVTIAYALVFSFLGIKGFRWNPR